MRTKSVSINKKFVVFCTTILVLGIIGIINNVSVADPGTVSNEAACTRSGSRSTIIDGYLELWSSSSSYDDPHDGVYGDDGYYYFYLGQEFIDSYDDFEVYIKNINPEGYLENVNTTLKPGPGVGSAIEIMHPYSNDTYISSNSVGQFNYQLSIGTNAKITTYELIIEIDFTVVDDQNNKFNKTDHIINIKLQLSTRIRNALLGEELELVARNYFGNTIPLYSGATNQLIVLPDIRSAYGIIDDVKITLNLPQSFTMDYNQAVVGELRTSSYEDIEWLLTSAGSINDTAQKIVGTFDVTYKLGTKTIIEKGVPIFIEISETPIVSLDGQIAEPEIGAKSSGKYISNVEIYQGATNGTFSLKFTNNGNIDLKEVDVELFTDNAAFFFKSDFYYDEGAQANKRTFWKSVNFGDIDIGQSSTKDFSTEIIKNLPPGLYRIPIKYSARYKQDGMTLIDFDECDFHEAIMAQQSSENVGCTPFLLVHVQEGDDENDINEPDLLAMSSTYVQPDMHSVLVAVELTNLENYVLSNVNAQISVGNGTPLQPLNDLSRTPKYIDAQEKDFTLFSANDPIFSNKYTVHFIVDIFQDANASVHEVPIQVTCLDSFNQKRTTMVKLPLNINHIPPRCVISDITTDNIEPNGNFTLTVKVYNCGGSNAKNVKLMFNGSSNLFGSEKSTVGPKSINKNEGAVFEFKINSGDVDPGATYTSSIYINFEDTLGNNYPFDLNPEHPITLRVKAESGKGATIDKAGEDETWEVDPGLAVVFLGVFILISVIVFGMIWSKASKKGPSPSAVADDTRVSKKRTGKPTQNIQKPRIFGRKGRKKSKNVDIPVQKQRTKQYPDRTPSDYEPGPGWEDTDTTTRSQQQTQTQTQPPSSNDDLSYYDSDYQQYPSRSTYPKRMEHETKKRPGYDFDDEEVVDWE